MVSFTPGNAKKMKRGKTYGPKQVEMTEVQRAEVEASQKISQAADKIMEAAVLITGCMKELKPSIASLANRNYREIQLSSNALKQLVSCSFCYRNPAAILCFLGFSRFLCALYTDLNKANMISLLELIIGLTVSS